MANVALRGWMVGRVLKTLKPNAGDQPRELLEREMVLGRLLFQALGTRDANGAVAMGMVNAGRWWSTAGGLVLRAVTCAVYQGTPPSQASCMCKLW
jgi:hypothetical protein